MAGVLPRRKTKQMENQEEKETSLEYYHDKVLDFIIINDIQGGFKRLNGTINSFKTAFVGTAVFGVIKGLTDIAGQAEKTELRFKRVLGSM